MIPDVRIQYYPIFSDDSLAISISVQTASMALPDHGFAISAGLVCGCTMAIRAGQTATCPVHGGSK